MVRTSRCASLIVIVFSPGQRDGLYYSSRLARASADFWRSVRNDRHLLHAYNRHKIHLHNPERLNPIAAQ
jgi:hypothetical protein